MIKDINQENDCRGIPFDNVVEVITYLKYASVESVMFQMLAITGCRMSELDNMSMNRLLNNYLYWQLGKNQKSHRKEKLPDYYLEELKEYRATHRVYGSNFFGISANTFRRYFSRDIRPKLSSAWQEIRIRTSSQNLGTEYILQLKGLRKNFQTLEFARQLDKWKDSGVAIEMVSKKMRHSSKGITAFHYVESFDALNIDKWKKFSPSEILQQKHQTCLSDF